MLSTPFFSLPLHASHQPSSLRAAPYKQSRKRKRDDGNEQDEEEGDSTSGTEDELPSSRTTTAAEGGHVPISGFTPVTQRSLAALAAPVDVGQYQVAGQPTQDPLPDNPYPHRPTHPLDNRGLGRGNATSRIYQEELASLSPPLFMPNSSHTEASPAAVPQQRSKLRQRHLSVLTTIFHRCVLDGDFLRAGRAWGMILRASSGKGVHLRREGMWGIGAEILLRRDTEISMLEEGNAEQTREGSSREADHPGYGTGAWFTRQGFERAKEYYERLVLQYQFRKWVPYSVSSLDFYPAMFGTWIYIVQAEYKVRQNGSRELPLSRDDRLSGSDPTPSTDEQNRERERYATEQEKLRRKTLRDAEEIAARMDELMLSPPYSDSPHLWNLRGMMSLWIGDLCMAPFPTVNRATRSLTEEGTDNAVEESFSKRNHEQKTRRNDEIERAKAAFEKAGRGGDIVWEGYMSFLEDSTNDSAIDNSQGE